MENEISLRPMQDVEMKHTTHRGIEGYQYSAVVSWDNLSRRVSSRVGKVKNLGHTFPLKTVNVNKTLTLSKKISKGEIIIGKTNSKVSMKKTIDLLKNLINKKGYFCVYVTFRRPFKTLLREFKKKHIKTEQMFFFDAVTRLSIDEDGNEQCSFVDSPQQLDYLLVFIKQKLDIINGRKSFLILDTLTNVLDHNSRRETIHFVHALTNKLRLINMGGNLIVPKPALRDNVSYYDFAKFVDISVAI